MKVLDDDPFFSVDVPMLRIRPSTPTEAAARNRRWAQSRARRLNRMLKAASKTDHRTVRQAEETAAAGLKEGPGPPPPWREVAAAWLRVRARFEGLFLS